MKIIFTISIIGLILLGCASKQIVLKDDTFKINEFNSKFIGTWELVKRLDDNGKKVDTIGYGQAYEIGEKPSTVFMKNGTYSVKFNTKHKHNGKWYYDSELKSLVLFRLMERNYWLANELIRRGIVKKHNDGEFYFKKMKYKIVQVSKDTLKYVDLNYIDRNMIYKRIK